jgi:hypothetical protein
MATKRIAVHKEIIFNFPSIVFLLPYSLLELAEAPPIHIPIPPHFGDCKSTLPTNTIPTRIIKTTKAVHILNQQSKNKEFP